MSTCRFGVAALVVVIAACSAAEGDGVAKPAAKAERAKVTCAAYYASVREGVLGTLRGTEHLPLVATVTQVSDMVITPGPDNVRRLTEDCGFDDRNFQKKRQPASTAARTLSASCTALIARIDARCLTPLVQQGTPLGKACSVALIGISAPAQELDERMRVDDYCRSTSEDL